MSRFLNNWITRSHISYCKDDLLCIVLCRISFPLKISVTGIGIMLLPGTFCIICWFYTKQYIWQKLPIVEDGYKELGCSIVINMNVSFVIVKDGITPRCFFSNILAG
ncbi:hypothetical protein FRX31_032185 [Thalictrum thalictroides]|uniref:Uncharacterized protein n=1 Tax=Thalictrum thalictroides TaxID=46969 RepID=A0A7J6UZY8_THATH|nr:hypothetical protein FRX31_032185 [Thalictrum thalictroides]